MTWRAWLMTMAALAMVACDSQPSGYPGQISKTFDGNKQLIIVADYSVRAMALGIRAWAEVAADTQGTIDMTGPWHMRCSGKFVIPRAGNAYPENLPGLDIGEGVETAPGFHAPPGRYKVVVAIPYENVSLSQSFNAGPSATSAFTFIYEPPGLCLLIADTRQQLADLTKEHVHAIRIWVGRMEPSQLKTQLIPVATKADQAAMAGDRATALDAVTTLSNMVEPVKDQPPHDLYRDIRISLGLLTQPLPES